MKMAKSYMKILYTSFYIENNRFYIKFEHKYIKSDKLKMYRR